MNALPGNPHYGEAHYNGPNGDWRLAQATLALAYEQRTATLVSLHQYATDLLKDGNVGGDEGEYVDHLDKLCDEINARLGKADGDTFRAVG